MRVWCTFEITGAYNPLKIKEFIIKLSYKEGNYNMNISDKKRNLENKLSKFLSNKQITLGNKDEFKQSAVAVPLIEKNNKLSLIFEVRSSKLKSQPCEICFPGGRIDKTDKTPLYAAIRETTEELGIKEENIIPIGPLDLVVGSIGALVYPFVVEIDKNSKMNYNKKEVEEIFTVPLSYLLTAIPEYAQIEYSATPVGEFPFNLLKTTYPKGYNQKIKYKATFYKYEDYVIWGLTAKILNQFINVCETILKKEAIS